MQDTTATTSSSSHHLSPRHFQHSRCFIAFGQLQDQLSLWVHSEDARHGNTNFLVGKHILESAGRKGETPFVSRDMSNIIRDGKTKHWLSGASSTYAVSVPKGCKEGIYVGRKQALNVCQAFDLELLRLFLDHFSVEGKTGSAGSLPVKHLSSITAGVTGERRATHGMLCMK